MFLAQLILGVSVTLSVLMVAMSMNDRAATVHLSEQQRFAADALAMQLAYGVRNPEVFKQLLADSVNTANCNQLLKCVKESTDCALLPGGMTAFQPLTCLYASDDPANRVFDEASTTAGFDMDGGPCNTFSDTTPDAQCLFRPVVTWRPLCTKAPCINQPVEVFVEVRMPLNSGVMYNSARRRLREIVY